MMSDFLSILPRWQKRIDVYIRAWMSTVQEIKAAIKGLPDADFREAS